VLGAIAPFRESIRLDPRFFAPRLNLLWTLTALNQFDDAKKVLVDARTANVQSIGFPQMAYVLAFVDNDTVTMTHELDAAVALPDGAWASNWQPRISAFGGRMANAHEGFRRSVMAISHANLRELSGLFSAQDAISHAVVGQCAEARGEAASAVLLSRENLRSSRPHARLPGVADAEASKVSANWRALSQRSAQAYDSSGDCRGVGDQDGQPGRGWVLEPVRPFDHARVQNSGPVQERQRLGAAKQLVESRRTLVLEITRKRIRRGTFTSVPALERAISEYLHQYNQQPKPFIWTKDADTILAKIDRCIEPLNSRD
jgi:hypothetical protein